MVYEIQALIQISITSHQFSLPFSGIAFCLLGSSLWQIDLNCDYVVRLW